MKSYIIAFLLFLFQLTYAPTLPIEQNKRAYRDYIEMNNFIKYQTILEKHDKEDLNILKKFKMTNKFTKEERIKVREVCEEVGIKSEWLYRVFRAECSGNPNAVNPISGATGLIGFLPNTANYLGTDTSELKKMCILDQLDYVKKYLLIIGNGKKFKSSLDLYLAIFRPSAIGKPDNYIIGDKGSIIVKQNKSYVKDSIITVKSIKSFIALL